MSQVRNKITQVMGIVNVTPDSFSDGGNNVEPSVAINSALRMFEQGADWIDVGGESTRPGAEAVSADVESARVLPVIQGIHQANALIKISVDTTKASVADSAVALGARMINDVSAGTADARMFEVAARHNVPMILMHRRGNAQTMQQSPHYDNVVAEVQQYLHTQAESALAAGVPTVYVDPGIGFGKTIEHNLTLLQNLESFAGIGGGVVLGISRKSFLGTIAGISNARDRDSATALAHALLWQNHVQIIRVHDVSLHITLRNLASALV